MKITYHYYYYPYRTLSWQCCVSYNNRVYSDSNNPAIKETKEEAKQRALEIFKSAYFLHIEEVEETKIWQPWENKPRKADKSK